MFLMPTVGMGVTICLWSDRLPATIIKVLSDGKSLVLQEDKANRIDNNGMSECQEYNYELDPNGTIYYASLRKDSTYRLVKSKTKIVLGKREKFHDYSF